MATPLESKDPRREIPKFQDPDVIFFEGPPSRSRVFGREKLLLFSQKWPFPSAPRPFWECILGKFLGSKYLLKKKHGPVTPHVLREDGQARNLETVGSSEMGRCFLSTGCG